MKHPTISHQRLRLILAFAATGGAIDICAYEHHFSITFMQPTTYPVMLQHKCGILFLICASWFLYELFKITFAFHPRTFYRFEF